jgi:hypothetical protein
MLVKLKNVRLAFPQLFEAKAFNGEGEPAYTAAFIFSKDDAAYKDVEAAIEAVAKEKWGAKAAQELKALKAADKTPLHDGDTKADYDGYAGNFFVSSRGKTRPLIIDRDKTPLTAADGKPYAGCFVNANIEIWPMANAFGKRICATLKGVQFYADGEAFSGSAPATPDDFESDDSDGESLV